MTIDARKGEMKGKAVKGAERPIGNAGGDKSAKSNPHSTKK